MQHRGLRGGDRAQICNLLIALLQQGLPRYLSPTARATVELDRLLFANPQLGHFRYYLLVLDIFSSSHMLGRELLGSPHINQPLASRNTQATQQSAYQ